MERIACRSCGKDLEVGTRFCPDCGTPTAGTDSGPAKATGSWKRDGLILAGLAVLVVGGYFILRNKSVAPPQPKVTTNIPGHEDMQGGFLDSLPTQYGPLVEQGNNYMDHENYAMAAEAYRRALAIDGASPDVRSDFASCLHAMGLPKRALDEFRKVLAADPKHVVAYFNLGVVFHGLGESDSARFYWQKYLAMDPNGQPAEAARQFLRDLDSAAAKPATGGK